MSHVEFCSRKVKSWVVLLATSSVAIIIFALATTSSGSAGDSTSTVNDEPTQRRPLGVALAPPPAQVRGVVAPPPVARVPRAVAQPPVVRTTPPVALPVAFVPSFTKAVGSIRPSVVNINATRPRGWARPKRAAGAVFIDPFDGVPDKIVGNRAFESVGSGVIVDPAGYILTNNHIVDGATSIVVSRFGRQEHIPAQIIATAPRKDLALLKLHTTGTFPAATFADSSKVGVGDWVLTVGNPFGLQHTVTSGIISGTKRSLNIGGVVYQGLLQTDAPINPGSSGGALTNIKGEVVGITTAIYAPTGVFSGAGFAIPSNQASAFVSRVLASRSKPVALVPVSPNPGQARGTGQARGATARGTRPEREEARRRREGQLGRTVAPPPGAPGAGAGAGAGAGRRRTRPPEREAGGNRGGVWLGLGAIDMTNALANILRYPLKDGAFVVSVVSGSPADRAGIKRRDVITSVGGRLIEGVDGIGGLVEGLALGQAVPLTVWRDGKIKRLTIGTVAK